MSSTAAPVIAPVITPEIITWAVPGFFSPDASVLGAFFFSVEHAAPHLLRSDARPGTDRIRHVAALARPHVDHAVLASAWVTHTPAQVTVEDEVRGGASSLHALTYTGSIFSLHEFKMAWAYWLDHLCE